MELDGRDASSTPVVTYLAAYIVLSYFVSLVGCITTLELLHRRTSRRGLSNWYLLVTSCITMGGIGIWSMHFIGNRAIVINNGEVGQQIVYSSSFTALSFFLPIIVLLVAFYLLGVVDQGGWYWVAISGTLTGTAVCGMHYVGQLGIANYRCNYYVQNVVGSAVISVLASTVALSVFFKLRNTWTDSWWKRSCCAAVLACAVSGMHWTAAVGTIYHLKAQQSLPSTRSRTQTVIVCTVLSLSACVILLGFSMLSGWNKKSSRRKAKQLILACAYFDELGRMMVSAEGAIPSFKITDQYVAKTFGEELNRTHPSFVWVFKASRNWRTLKDYIPGMKESLDSDPKARKFFPGQVWPDDGSVASQDFSGVFKKLFCVAAQSLANSIHEPIENLGPLFEEPFETGTRPSKNSLSIIKRVRGVHRLKSSDPESSTIVPYVFGKGLYFFLTRQLSKSDVVKFGAHGYRFATPLQIADQLADNMQVPEDHMLRRLERMRNYSSKENLLLPGFHLACFVLRPSIQKSFDVLVPTTKQSQLPHITFPFTELKTRDAEVLQKFDESPVAQILKALIHPSSGLEMNQPFRWQLYRAFSQLVELTGDPATMMEAKFSAKPISAPCQPLPGQTGQSNCVLFPVRVISAVQAQSATPNQTYVPLSFFNAQQQLESSGRSHEIFARQTSLEFSYLGQAQSSNGDSNRSTLHSKCGSKPDSAFEMSIPLTPTSFKAMSVVGGGGVTAPAAAGREKRAGESLEMTQTLSEHEELRSSVSHVEQDVVDMHHSDAIIVDKEEEDDGGGGTFVGQMFALFRL